MVTRLVTDQAVSDLGDVKEAGYTAFVEKYLKFKPITSGKSHASIMFMPPQGLCPCNNSPKSRILL